MEKKLGITVAQAISLGTLNRLHLVGGSQGVERIIRLVNIIEIPDIVDHLKEGEFLLTTGYSFRENPELMKQLIPRMADKGCAALAIKPKRFIKEIDNDIIEHANQYGIPLLEIPYDLNFSEIIAPILGAISSKQTLVLQILDKSHKDLMNAVLKRSPLSELCEKTAKLINNPVAIKDLSGNITASVNFDQPALLKNGDTMIPNEDVLNINTAPQIYYETKTFSQQNNNSQKQVLISLPIVADKHIFGNIYSLCYNPISELEILILEGSATIAALEFLRQSTVFQTEQYYSNEFLDILLLRDFEDEEDLVNRGKVFSINLRKPIAVAIISVKSDREPRQQSDSIGLRNIQRDQLIKNINAFSSPDSEAEFFAFGKGGDIIILVELPGESQDVIDHVTVELEHYLQGIPYIQDIKGGVGRIYNGARNISQSYKEAREALRICKLLSNRPALLHFNNLGFYRVLAGKTREELNNFVMEYLRPILDYDREKGGELLKTVCAYYRTGRNLRNTAKDIFVHYNTAIYRMSKIEELTGIKFNNPTDALNLELAVNLYTIINVSL